MTNFESGDEIAIKISWRLVRRRLLHLMKERGCCVTWGWRTVSCSRSGWCFWLTNRLSPSKIQTRVVPVEDEAGITAFVEEVERTLFAEAEA